MNLLAGPEAAKNDATTIGVRPEHLDEASLAEDAQVVIADINLAAAEKAAAGIGATDLHLDVTDQASIDACVAAAEAKMGGIDILINYAALFAAAELIDITRASYDRLFAVNVGGALVMTQAVAKGMIARGKGGTIINMASQAGRRGAGRRLLRD